MNNAKVFMRKMLMNNFLKSYHEAKDMLSKLVSIFTIS